jgi:GxxExxY protein
MEAKDEKVIYPELSYKIVGCLFEVYNELGSNHREKYYQSAVEQELINAGIGYNKELKADLRYKNKIVGKNYFDFLIDDKIVLEIKVGSYFKKKDFEQVLDYLKTSGYKLGIVGLFKKDEVKFFRILNA